MGKSRDEVPGKSYTWIERCRPTDYPQVFAADKARNEIHAISFVVVGSFALRCGVMPCMNGAAIYAGQAYRVKAGKSVLLIL
jgi:hypothetical protein